MRCTNRTPSCSRLTKPASSPRHSHRAIPIHTAQFLVFTPRLCVVSQLVLVAWREAVKSNHRLRDNVLESLRLTRSKHALRHLRLGIEASKEQGRKALRLMASGELRSIRAALVKWMEIISEADAAREKMWGAVGRMRNTKLAAGFLGWLGAVEAIATAKALMALCVRTFINKVLLLPGQTYELPPPPSTLSPPPIPAGHGGDRPGLRRTRCDGEAPRHAARPRRRHGLHGAHLAERLGLPEYGPHAQRRRER